MYFQFVHSKTTLKNHFFYVAHAMYYYAVQQIPSFGYAIRHAFFVSLMFYDVKCYDESTQNKVDRI